MECSSGAVRIACDIQIDGRSGGGGGGGGGPLMWMMPLHLQVNQKSNYDDDVPLILTALLSN